MFITGDAIFGMHHTTTELSLTEENRSSNGSGKIYWEGLQSIHNINNDLGLALKATGYQNEREMSILLDVAYEKTPKGATYWTDKNYVEFEDASSISSILKAAPNNLVITHGGGYDVWVSTELAKIMGLTPEGGVNLVAKCIVDIIRHYGVHPDDRPKDWTSTRDQLLNIYVSCCKQSVVGDDEFGEGRNTPLKNATKSGKRVYTMKVRGIEASWVTEGEVYLASNDPWAGKLQGKRLLVWRNPNPSYLFAVVKIVGPATEYCEFPDIVRDKQLVAKACLTVPAIEWYGGNNGDDDGDLCNFLSIDALMSWVKNPKNLECIKSVPRLFRKLYPNTSHTVAEQATVRLK
jgi:hypothetical protein